LVFCRSMVYDRVQHDKLIYENQIKSITFTNFVEKNKNIMSGGFGRISDYDIKGIQLFKNVILKTSKPSISERFLKQEAIFLRHLSQCPNVVSLHHAFFYNKEFYIAMEKAEKHITKPFLYETFNKDLEKFNEIVFDMFNALYQLQVCDIIHLDIKTSN